MNTVPITEIAAVIRSKNAGPYELTVDIMFKDESDYLWLKKINFFTRELFADLYGIPVSKIIKMVYFDAAFAVKCTMARSTVSGAPGDTDIYGAQQHAPLLKLTVPVREA
jgi:hypothetical protein